jgi:DNA-directed RNA polymerase I subunit RPA49
VLDPLASAVLETMAEGSSSMPTREELQAEADEAKPRPKVNLAATTPAEVYTLEALLGTEALRGLNVRGWQDDVRAGKEVQTTSRFVARRVVRVVEGEDVKMLKALRYVLLMLNWFDCLKTIPRGGKKLPDRDVVKKAVGEGVLDSLMDGLRRRFAKDG